MTKPLRIEVEGLADFQRDLRSMDKKWPSQLRATNKKAATIVSTEAARTAPVLTGRLRKSIKAMGQQREAIVKAGTNVTIPYAAVQEFGWPGHGIEPQPYLFPAIRKKREEVVEVYAEMIDDLSRRAFPR